MENLEKEIIKRLNGVLNKYNLEIISKNNHNYKTTISVDDTFKKRCKRYVVVEIKDNTIIECYYTWDNIKNMLLYHFLNYSLFDAINQSCKIVNYCTITNTVPDKYHLLIAKLYNEFMVLNNCSSYEEIIMKMDLMGI